MKRSFHLLRAFTLYENNHNYAGFGTYSRLPKRPAMPM